MTITFGISKCLLGEKTRYDGGDKLDPFLRDTVGAQVSYVAICPEADCGMPIPREPIHLEGPPRDPRVVTVDTRVDVTQKLASWAKERVRALHADDLCAFVLKAKSPSCGLRDTKIYPSGRGRVKRGAGLWALHMMWHHPLVPLETEDRLALPHVRDRFFENAFVLRRFRAQRKSLATFHKLHRLQLRSRSPKLLKEMDLLVSQRNRSQQQAAAYELLLLRALLFSGTRHKHTRLLIRVASQLKGQVSDKEAAALRTMAHDFAEGRCHLAQAIGTVRYLAQEHGCDELASQTYLTPHPIEQSLRWGSSPA